MTFERWVTAQDAVATEAYLETAPKLQLCTAEFPLRRPFPADVLTHTGEWMSGHATQYGADGSVLVMEAPGAIRFGTSGSPVVTDDGLLLGVVSSSGGVPGGASQVTVVRVHLAAPGWLVRTMLDPEYEARVMRAQIESMRS